MLAFPGLSKAENSYRAAITSAFSFFLNIPYVRFLPASAGLIESLLYRGYSQEALCDALDSLFVLLEPSRV